jgi:Polyketide cyclase / dehydrase and lipid transport
MGATSRDQVTITEYDPPRQLVYESESKLGHFRHTFELAPASGGTRVSKTFDLQKTSFMMKLFTPTILVLAPRQQKTDLERIKQNLEKAATPG